MVSRSYRWSDICHVLALWNVLWPSVVIVWMFVADTFAEGTVGLDGDRGASFGNLYRFVAR